MAAPRLKASLAKKPETAVFKTRNKRPIRSAKLCSPKTSTKIQPPGFDRQMIDHESAPVSPPASYPHYPAADGKHLTPEGPACVGLSCCKLTNSGGRTNRQFPCGPDLSRNRISVGDGLRAGPACRQ